MKIRTDLKSLSDTIAWVSQAVPKKASHAALTGVQLEAESGELSMYAFDYDTSHEGRVEADVAESDRCLVPATFLREVVGAMRAETITLEVVENRLVATAGRATYRSALLDLADYPTPPKFPEHAGEISASKLVALVDSVKHPIDDSTPHERVRGLHIEGDEKTLSMVGATAPSIAARWAKWGGLKTFDATVHSKAAIAAIKGLSGTVSIGQHEGHIGFADDARTVTMRCYGHEYAEWRKLIRPESHDDLAAEMAVDEILEAVRRASAVTGATGGLVLDVSPGQIELRSTNDESGDGVEVVDADVDGAANLTMQPRLLADALAATPTSRVRIGFKFGHAPIVIRPLDAPEAVCVVMPKFPTGRPQ